MEIVLEELLYKKKKLKNTPDDVLVKLTNDYPYSAVFHILINKKHFLQYNNLSLNKFKNLVNLTDNPGMAFVSIIEGAVKEQEKKKKKKKQKKKSTQNPPEDSKLRNEIVSEQLAEIYLKQGMKKEAMEMYRKLSLQNPEKSVYFAKILEKIKKNLE